MSFLTQINNLFSKKQSEQLVGVSLQQESISFCSLPALHTIKSLNKKESKDVFFQQVNVQQNDFSAAIIETKASTRLVGKWHVVLNSQQAQIVQVDKPSVPEAEINSALKWQIKDLVSISPDNMVIDYFDGPILTGGKEKINVVCAPVDVLKTMLNVINQDGSEVVSITIAEFAFANLLPIENDASLLVCQQPNEEIVLLIVKQGKLYFHRRLRGFSNIAQKTEDELTLTAIDSLALEIQRSSDYFERQLKQAPIKDIKVLLPMKLESFFARKLAENSHMPVNLLVLPESHQAHRQYACAIGATMTEANLITKHQEPVNVS